MKSDAVIVGEKLSQGAEGVVHIAEFAGQTVCVKVSSSVIMCMYLDLRISLRGFHVNEGMCGVCPLSFRFCGHACRFLSYCCYCLF